MRRKMRDARRRGENPIGYTAGLVVDGAQFGPGIISVAPLSPDEGAHCVLNLDRPVS